MPLEINKLEVMISVNQAKSEGGEGSSEASNSESSGEKSNPEKLAKDVIEQILDIIDNKNER